MSSAQWLRLVTPPRNELFNSALEDTPRQEDTASASETLHTDISAQPHHLPVVAAAGVHLFKSDHVTELYFQNHS
jgi:hypothetical protein